MKIKKSKKEIRMEREENNKYFQEQAMENYKQLKEVEISRIKKVRLLFQEIEEENKPKINTETQFLIATGKGKIEFDNKDYVLQETGEWIIKSRNGNVILINKES